jgi:hypothetical protein
MSFRKWPVLDAGTNTIINHCILKSKSKLNYDRLSADLVLVSCTHLGKAANFSPSFFNYF